MDGDLIISERVHEENLRADDVTSGAAIWTSESEIKTLEKFESFERIHSFVQLALLQRLRCSC